MYLSTSTLTDFAINTRNLINEKTATAPALLYKVAVTETGTLTLKSSTPTGATAFDVGYMIFTEAGTELARGNGINVTKTLAVSAGNYVIKLSNINGVASDANLLGVAKFNIEISLATAVNQTPTITDLTTSTTTTTTTPLTAQQSADKLAITLLKTKIKAGISLSDNEAIFYLIGDSVVSSQVITILEAGGGYEELKTLGLTETQTLDVLVDYNKKIAPSKYESELGIDAIEANKLLLSSFLTYLQTNNVELPSFMSLYTAIRSKPAIYSALRDWNKTRAV